MSLVKRLIEIWLLGRAAATGNAFLTNLLARLTTIVTLAVSACIIGLILSAGLLALIYMSLAAQGISPAMIIVMMGSVLLVLLLVIIYVLRYHLYDIKQTSRRFTRDQQNPLTDSLAVISSAFMAGLSGKKSK